MEWEWKSQAKTDFFFFFCQKAAFNSLGERVKPCGDHTADPGAREEWKESTAAAAACMHDSWRVPLPQHMAIHPWRGERVGDTTRCWLSFF